MPKADLGTKHLCENCGAKFYDMQKTPPTCPSCGMVVELEVKRRTREAAPEAKKVVPVAEEKAAPEDEVEDLDDDDDADLLPDDDEDEDDLGDVGVGGTKPQEDEES